MIDKKLWFLSSAGRANHLDVTCDEPSHIHIARPSRRRRDTLVSPSEPTSAELPELDPAAAQLTLQAA